MRKVFASVLLALAACLPREAVACSTSHVFGTRAPLFLHVAAQSDTVRAGRGLIIYTERLGSNER